MNNNNQLSVERGQCSFYNNVRAKENITKDISEFVTPIREGKWKDETLRYRQLMKEGKTAEAARIKNNLPAILIAGRCEGGHTKANIRSLSGDLMVDIDHEENAPKLLQELKKQPWVHAGWISVSGEGIKVVVKVMAETQQEYEKQAYPLVAARISELLGVQVDMQCKDISRLCFASWDPEAFINENCEVFPWRETITQNNSSIIGFYERFCRTHSFVPGSRHDFLLKLGASARRNGMNLEELDRLIGVAESNLFAPDYAPGEIRRNITDSYRFTANHSKQQESYQGVRGHHRHFTYSTDSEKEAGMNENDKEELAKEKAFQLRTDAPNLPDYVFEELPDILKKGVSVAKNKRQRDMLLLSMLTNLSGCMPNVRMLYDDTYIYPHLFLTVVASSASGKGIMTHAAKLGKKIQQELDEINQKRQKEFEESWMEWELEHSKALKEKRKANLDLKPEPMLRETLFVPADVSRSQLIQLMCGSPHGVLLNTSEFDTLRSALNAEYAKFDDLMRACFHHEMFGSDFKSDKRAYMVYCPKMAFCGSGTPSQFYQLCPSVENGSYSRYLIYLAEQDADFMSMAPRGKSANKFYLFDSLSTTVLDMYHFLKDHPTEVMLSSEQWALHESFFKSFVQHVKMEEVEGPLSVVFRYGLSTARIAMILTALRKFEAHWKFNEITCTDEDFRLALGIMEVLLSHSLMFSTSLHKCKIAPTEMRKYFKVRRALEKLRTEFTYTELIEALMSEEMSESTARRYRQRLLNMEIIVQQGDKYHFSTRLWRGKLDKFSQR